MRESFKGRVARVFHLLKNYYKIDEYRSKKSLFEIILQAILSQNTSDVNSSRAFKRIIGRIKSWQELLALPEEELLRLISPAGIVTAKARALREISSLFLDDKMEEEKLCQREVESGLAMLTSIKGIGVKTAAIILAFGCGKDLCPVDTHVNRVTKRLGLIPNNSNPEKTFYKLKSMIPDGIALQLHRLLIKHGRTLCKARKPICSNCPLIPECAYYGN